MSDHHPLCERSRGEYVCICGDLNELDAVTRADERRQVILDGEAGIVYRDLETDIRLDERRRIAQAIEADRDSAPVFYEPWRDGMTDAARIARNGGRDE